jgi:hypothetical protein
MVARQPGHEEVDGGFEGALLAFLVVSPERMVDRLPAPTFDDAEQVLQSLAGEWIALHIEEEVARGGRW